MAVPDGTHPTGMHSSLGYLNISVKKYYILLQYKSKRSRCMAWMDWMHGSGILYYTYIFRFGDTHTDGQTGRETQMDRQTEVKLNINCTQNINHSNVIHVLNFCRCQLEQMLLVIASETVTDQFPATQTKIIFGMLTPSPNVDFRRIPPPRVLWQFLLPLMDWQ